MKPSHEIWVLCRKPLVGTVAANVLEHGVGGLHIDACRVGASGGTRRDGKADRPSPTGWENMGGHGIATLDAGRWPPNTLLSHSAACGEQCAPGCPVPELDRQSGERPGMTGGGEHAPDYPGGMFGAIDSPGTARGDTGGASRFFPQFNPDPFPFLYSVKPSTAERDAGLDRFQILGGGEATGRVEGSAGTKSPRAGAGRLGGRRNGHPTVKGHELMRWLCRLVTPPGGIVLDPFAGSGATGLGAILEGFSFRGVELDPYHADLASARISYVVGGEWEPRTEKAVAVEPKQGSLF